MNLDRFLRGRLVRDRMDFLRVNMDVLLRCCVANRVAVTLRLGEPNPARGKVLSGPAPPHAAAQRRERSAGTGPFTRHGDRNWLQAQRHDADVSDPGNLALDDIFLVGALALDDDQPLDLELRLHCPRG